VIADCDDRYIYFINDRIIRVTPREEEEPLNFVIIRYDLEHLRIDAISEPRRTEPRWVALLGEKLFVSSSLYRPPHLLEAIYSWRPWPSGGFSPREPVRLSDSLAIELSYLVGLTCGSPALVSNQNSLVYVMDVARLLDTTSAVRDPVRNETLLIEPNPVVGSRVTLRGVERIANIWLWDTQGRRLSVQWIANPDDGATIELVGIASGIYRIEVVSERGERLFEPLVMLR